MIVDLTSDFAHIPDALAVCPRCSRCLIAKQVVSKVLRTCAVSVGTQVPVPVQGVIATPT